MGNVDQITPYILFVLLAFYVAVHRATAFDHRVKRFLTWPTTRSSNVVQVYQIHQYGALN